MGRGRGVYGGLRNEEWSSPVGVRNGGIAVNRATLPTGIEGGMVFPQSEHSVDDTLRICSQLASSLSSCFRL